MDRYADEFRSSYGESGLDADVTDENFVPTGQINCGVSTKLVTRSMFLALIISSAAFLWLVMFYEMNFLYSLTFAFVTWWIAFFVLDMLYVLLAKFTIWIQDRFVR